MDLEKYNAFCYWLTCLESAVVDEYKAKQKRPKDDAAIERASNRVTEIKGKIFAAVKGDGNATD